MPELPEVETTRRGLALHLPGRRITGTRVHNAALRRPVAGNLAERVDGWRIEDIERRGKYLSLELRQESGDEPSRYLLIHLGMTGSLRIDDHDRALKKHDHIVILLDQDLKLVFNDPRRFGLFVVTDLEPRRHPLLSRLGPEPWDRSFNGAYLYRVARQRKVAVKPFVMDARVVVGVGNIYASEALFRCGIHPARIAARIAEARYELLVETVREVLSEAIEAGGTTLRDFRNAENQPGYFQQQLAVYGRTGSPCRRCGEVLRSRIIAQRNSFFCAGCQR